MRRTILLAVALLAMAPAPVEGQTLVQWGRQLYVNRIAPSAHPTATYRAMTTAQKGAVKAFLKRTSIHRATSTTSRNCRVQACPNAIAATSGWCVEYEQFVWGKNALGWEVWRLTLHQHVCTNADGSAYTEAWSRVTAKPEMWGWSYSQIDHTNGGGVPPAMHFESFVQGNFGICLGGGAAGVSLSGCLQSQFPWIDDHTDLAPPNAPFSYGNWSV